MRVRKWPVVGLLLAVLWLFVRGVEFAPRPLAGEFLIGLAVGLPMAYGFRRLYLPTVDVGRSLWRAPTAAYFVAVFLWEVVTANVDVAYRVLHPSMPIEPDVVEVPLRVESDAAVTTIANSITLTPGTLTMDHDEAINTLYVHGIIGRRRRQVLAPIRRWEDLLLVIFDEDGDPGDEPPAPSRGRTGEGTASGAASGDATADAPPEDGSADGAPEDGSADGAPEDATAGVASGDGPADAPPEDVAGEDATADAGPGDEDDGGGDGGR